MTRRTLLNAALISLTLTACGGGGSSTPTATIASIDLTPPAATVPIGDTTPLTATARDAQGTVVPNAAFTWTSSAESVATVAGGVVTGKAAGRAQVTASAAGVTSAPAELTVTAPTPAAGFTLAVSADKLPVITGTGASLTVTVTRDAGFTDAVAITLNGLPSGATAPTVTLPAGQTSATVTVNAAASAPHSQPTAVTVKGSAGTRNVSKTVTVTVRGPAGSLDTTFGAGGVSVTPMSAGDDYLNAVAVQADGKIVAVGTAPGAAGNEFAVARFTRDGALDPTFGTGGKVLIDFAGKSDVARAVAVQADGRMVVAGGTTDAADRERFGLVRLTAAGALDSTFGTAGRVTTAFSGSAGDRANALVLQPDGKIVAGGSASFGSASSGVDFALARYDAAGTLDAGFGTGGTVTTSMSTSGASDTISALTLQGQAIVAVGGTGDFKVARYTAAGALDGSFGSGGRVTGVFGVTIGSANAVTTDAQGRVVVAGTAQNDTAVIRLTAAGALDPSFGTGGKRVIALTDNWDAAEGVAVQSDGKIVLGGWIYEGNSSAGDFAVTRLTATGQNDSGFGSGGTTLTKVAPGSKSDLAHAVALQPDDRIPATRIVLAGERSDSNSDVALTRYWP